MPKWEETFTLPQIEALKSPKKHKQAAYHKVITFPLLFYLVIIQNIDLYSKLPVCLQHKVTAFQAQKGFISQ